MAKMKVQVIGVEHFNGKRGVGYTLVCFDQDVENRLTNTFDYQVSDLDKDRHGDPETFKNQVVDIAITGIESGFGGRMRMRGQILTAPKSVK